MADTHYFATITLDGTLTNPGSTDGAVPSGCTILTKEQFDTAAAVIAAGGHCKMVSGVLLPTAPVTQTAPELSAVKAGALTQVDAAAENARMLFLTAGSGQALEYEATRLEAAALTARLQADPNATINPQDYPWLKAERDALASIGQTVSMAEVAQAVMQTVTEWVGVGASIKTTRRSAKLAIDAATSPDQVSAIMARLHWPSPAD